MKALLVVLIIAALIYLFDAHKKIEFMVNGATRELVVNVPVKVYKNGEWKYTKLKTNPHVDIIVYNDKGKSVVLTANKDGIADNIDKNAKKLLPSSTLYAKYNQKLKIEQFASQTNNRILNNDFIKFS